MDLHAFYIAAGELAGERVAGLVEEDGDELERREQERPPEEEDDDGGDANGGDEDPLVAVAAALQLPVDGHPLVARRRSTPRSSGSNSGGRGCAGGGGGARQRIETARGGALAWSNWKRACVRAQEPRERERDGRAASLRVVVVGGWVSAARMGADCREILIAPVRAARQPTPGDARTFVVNERTPDYVAITGVRRL